MIAVSVREAYWVAERVLFSIGLPAGCTNDAARLVVSLEIDYGTGLSLLDRQIHEPFGSFEPPGCSVTYAGAFAEVDARGHTALYAGPPALDVACSQAVRHGVGAVVIRQLAGLPYAPALLSYARHRGMDGFLSSIAIEDQVEPIVTKSDFRTRTDSPSMGPAVALLEAFQSLAASQTEDPTARALSRVALNAVGSVLLACVPVDSVAAPKKSTLESGPLDWRGFGPFVLGDEAALRSRAEQEALSKGLPVDDALWHRLSQATRGGLASIEEGSRADAGPGTGRRLLDEDDGFRGPHHRA
jgi:hypothetical protein